MKVQVGGYPVMSLETRLLHSDHARALRDWREHRQRCVQCEKAGRKRDEKRCGEGSMLWDVEKDLQAKAREADQLDALPNPDQGALF